MGERRDALVAQFNRLAREVNCRGATPGLVYDMERIRNAIIEIDETLNNVLADLQTRERIADSIVKSYGLPSAVLTYDGHPRNWNGWNSWGGHLNPGEYVVPTGFLERLEESCPSCRLSLPGHMCGHYWVDGVRYSSTSGFRLHHRVVRVWDAIAWVFRKTGLGIGMSLVAVIALCHVTIDFARRRILGILDVGLFICGILLILTKNVVLASFGTGVVFSAVLAVDAPGRMRRSRGGQVRHPTATIPPPVISRPTLRIATQDECAYCFVLARPCACKRGGQ